MMRCPHCQASTELPQLGSLPAGDSQVLRSRSTETEAQELRIIAALRLGPKTTDDLRKLGAFQVSARIWKLRQVGYVIETDLFDGYAADGYSHARMARYTLRSEPLQANEAEVPCKPA